MTAAKTGSKPNGKIRKVRSAKDRVRGMDRELQALELRKAGASYSMMSKHMGISAGACRAALLRALEWIEKECREEAPAIRRLEMERLDAMRVGSWARAAKGDAAAVNLQLSIMRQYARYTPGLEIVPGIELSGPGGGPITTSTAELGLLTQRFEQVANAVANVVGGALTAVAGAAPAVVAALPKDDDT